MLKTKRKRTKMPSRTFYRGLRIQITAQHDALKRPFARLTLRKTPNLRKKGSQKKFAKQRFFGKRRRRRKKQRSCPFGQLLAKCALRRRGRGDATLSHKKTPSPYSLSVLLPYSSLSKQRLFAGTLLPFDSPLTHTQSPRPAFAGRGLWQGRRDSNTQQTVLETVALPLELLPYG